MTENATMPDTVEPKKSLGEGMRDRLEAMSPHRRERLLDLWNGMSEREQLLFKEGAVMGFVRGSMHAEGRATRAKYPDLFAAETVEDPIPPDSVIVLDVLGGCGAYPDIYPTVTSYEDCSEDEDDEG